MRSRSRSRVRSTFEHLETRTLFSGVGDAVDLAEQGYVPVTWNGQETYAKAGEWILRLDGLSGEVNTQLNAARSVLGRLGLNVKDHLGSDGLLLIESASSAALEQVQALLQRVPGAGFVEPNFRLSINETPNNPDDPSFTNGSLWGLHNTGQNNGTADADIDAPEAWESTTGSGTVVAVVDTGVDYNHPDINDNMWVNAAEAGGVAGTDDDGNGFVDDIHGYDFANNDGNPIDDQGHGTHVAGTIAAEGNNGIGVAGVNWDAQVMALKFLDSSGSGTGANAIRALNYAVANGAKVSNHSYGGEPFSRLFYDAIAESDKAGHLFVAGAGNGTWYGSPINNDSTPFFPANYGHNDKLFDDPATAAVESLPSLENVISVTATDTNDAKASWANYGAKSVDVGAPGVNIYSLAIGGGYKNNTGTSMASPHVAGAAALLWSASPGASLGDVKTALLTGGDSKTSLASNTSTGRRLNLNGSLAKLPATVAPATPGGLAATAVSSGRIDLAWNDVSGEAGYTIERSTGTSGTWNKLATVGANTTSFSDTTVQPSTSTQANSYSYRVKATNGTLHSGYSEVVSATTPVLETPAAPTGLTAVADGSTRVNLAWTDNGYEAGFKVRRSTDAFATYTEILVAGNGATPTPTTVAYSDTGLAAGTQYQYRVLAYNGTVNSAASNDAFAKTASASPVGTGGGLRGRYYDTSKFSNLKMTRIDNDAGQGLVAGSTGIDFNWGTSSPSTSGSTKMGADSFSVRWQGQVQPRYNEDYTFYVKADDGVRLWVNGQLLVNIWRSNTSTWAGVPLSLTAGQQYDIQMDYYEGSGGAMAKLMWSSPSLNEQGTAEVIPAKQLYSYALDAEPAAKTVPSGTGDVGTHISSVGPRTRPAAPAGAFTAAQDSSSATKQERRLVDDVLA